MKPFDRVCSARATPLARRQTREGEEPIAGFLQAVGDGFVFEAPLADEGLAVLFDLFWRFRVDHFVVVVSDFLMQALRGVREEIPVLMNRASLHRHAVPNGGDRALEPRAAIDDEEIGPPQAALDEIVEHGAPGLGALAAHLPDRQQHFLTVLAHPDDDEQRDGSGLRSSRTRTTVPSRISRTIGSSASEREFHASQSPFTLRHTRLTVSLPTAPPNTL